MPACGWDVTYCATCTPLDNLSDEVRASIEEWAVTRLWEWTRQRFGPCEVSYRPCKTGCGGVGPGAWAWATVTNGIPFTCGSCGDSCSCRYVSEVILPGPIDSVVEILVDGLPLAEDAVVVYDYNRLTRVDGGRFPTCQDLGRLPDEDGTWQVTYMIGEPVPPAGDIIAGVLACEYAKAICGDPTCRLPKTLKSSARQGLTIVNMSSFENLAQGGTGIWEIDDWVLSQNNPMRKSLVSSPDIVKQRRMTWSSASS